MKKNYFYSIILMVFLCSLSLSAQASKQPVNPNTPYLIEGLNLYPNPVNSSRIVNISTKNDSDKEIIIFDLLGKKVLQTQLSTRELNVANLIPGVYIIKINEGNASATRKLIIR
ncbi:T9SS type A sorting domain-containing protein [Flavobacterium sp. FZUC8N2.13]|uniref:T9SS type A sorting domain-containing protein n=1 Tax=Flavobacterium zubiriense TaxID=3138075 RepID=A0ABV4TDP4_9FLAO